MNDEQMKKAMGKIIYELRTRKGMTQQELADLMEVTRPAVTKMEKGRIDIPATRLHQLATIFGVPARRLLPKQDAETIAEVGSPS